MQFSTLLLAFIGIASESVIAEKIKPYPHYFGCEGVTWAGKSAPQPICGKLITPPVTPTDFNIIPPSSPTSCMYPERLAMCCHEGTVDFHVSNMSNAFNSEIMMAEKLMSSTTYAW
ncbi:hypothetical protein MJO28_005551 [Puccinia striiformis f. sp. tritici]|uniref:Hydrophobin n=2 Tax=Puccinia striiformis TaxID=27350 RepID=A0A2S4VL31_9BASI|nr:hypothetical protein MJO28_005551 [Puccinia striiformis f. sp. tritici]POW10252.1 hypothetical protein PSHT_08816 [Puccinia striiformis]